MASEIHTYKFRAFEIFFFLINIVLLFLHFNIIACHLVGEHLNIVINTWARGAWWATVHGVAKSQTQWSTHTYIPVIHLKLGLYSIRMSTELRSN